MTLLIVNHAHLSWMRSNRRETHALVAASLEATVCQVHVTIKFNRTRYTAFILIYIYFYMLLVSHEMW